MAGFFVDENNSSLVDPTGLRPTFGAAGIISCTMSGSTQELTIPVAATGQANGAGQRIVTVTTGPQGAYIAFDVAGQGANYTGPTNMLQIPQNWLYSFTIKSTDASVYVLQAGTAGVFQLCVLKTA